jgi:O-antigen ligase
MASLLFLAMLIFATSPFDRIKILLRPQCLVGFFIYLMLWMLAFLTPTGIKLKIVMPMFGSFVCFLMSLWLSSRFAGKKEFGLVLLPALLFAVGVNLFEFMLAPNSLSTAPGRAAGFFENPNNSGNMIVALAALVVVSLDTKKWLLICLCLLSFVGVLVTFSRGSIFLIVLIYISILISQKISVNRFITNIIAPVLAFGLTIALVLNWIMQQNLSNDANLRLFSILKWQFHDNSTLGRIDFFMVFLNRFLNNPLIGAEPFGSLAMSHGAGPHNAFVAAGADFGIVGLIAFLAVIVFGIQGAMHLKWKGPQALTLLVCSLWLLIYSLFSHIVFYSSSGAIMIGILLGALPVRFRCQGSASELGRY